MRTFSCHFRSRDKDGGHTIRSAITENPMLHTNCMFELLRDRNGDFGPRFCSCDLDLDPMTFTYELDPYSLEYTGCAKMNFLHQSFRK